MSIQYYLRPQMFQNLFSIISCAILLAGVPVSMGSIEAYSRFLFGRFQ